MAHTSSQTGSVNERLSLPNGAIGPLQATTLTDQCYERLKAAIISLELRPRANLSEVRLAARLGVSKSPVREAIARLAGEGFVTNQAGRKSHVADLSASTISDFYQVRMLLEPASLRNVGARLTEDDFARLQEFIDEDEKSIGSEDRSTVVMTSHGFHLLLIERSENAYLCKLSQHLFDQTNRVRAAIFLAEQRSAQHELSYRGIENHQAILDALKRGQTAHAADLLRDDIEMFLNVAVSPEMQRAFDAIADSGQMAEG